MNNYKSLRALIKEMTNQDTCKELLSELGVKIGRNYRFVENDSFSINRNGTIKDFGSTGFTGDIVSFMIDVLGIPPREAIEWTAKSLGVWDE